jgi:hypothetical protein
VIAELKIMKPGKMSPAGRRQVAMWIRRHLAIFLKDGKNYGNDDYRGRYVYTPEKSDPA